MQLLKNTVYRIECNIIWFLILIIFLLLKKKKEKKERKKEDIYSNYYSDSLTQKPQYL